MGRFLRAIQTILCGSSRDAGILLQSPDGRNLQVLRAVGTAGSNASAITVTIQDGGTAMPNQSGTGVGAFNVTGTYRPTANVGRVGTNPSYSPGPAIINNASDSLTAPVGNQTLNGVFVGAGVNGTWNVYLADDGVTTSFGGSDVEFTSFDLIITFSGASTPSTTTLGASPTTAFTSGAGSSVTLTANVTAGATGSVTFQDGGANITCSGANPATLSSGVATCVATFATEGVHVLTANYGGNATFLASSGSANIFVRNHATNTGNTYCNTGPINTLGTSATVAGSLYPSVIVVGDGVNTSIPNSVSTVSLRLTNFSATQAGSTWMLLVSPDDTRAYEFFGAAAAAMSAGNYTFQDGSGLLPGSGTNVAPGTYGPTNTFPFASLTPNAPSPAPQLPSGSIFTYAPAAGTSTFFSAFNGTTANGTWKLFIHNRTGPGNPSSAAQGWCLTVTPNTGTPTTTTLTSNPTPRAVFGASVTFTATVSPTPSSGTVTFSENGAPLGAAVNVVAGVATFTTSSLIEGDHTISAAFIDSTNTFSSSQGTLAIRVDRPTTGPAISGNTYTYCNPGTVTIPAGTLGLVNNIGKATPNPSLIAVANLPGTIQSMTTTLKGYHTSNSQGPSIRHDTMSPIGTWIR